MQSPWAIPNDPRLVTPTAQCPRCGHDFRPDEDPFSPDNDLCGSCADHAVLCGCSDEFCGEA